jgi:predicted N-formylglutamate amidohydrolase
VCKGGESHADTLALGPVIGMLERRPIPASGERRSVSLLEPDEPPPVQIERAESDSPFVFACDHAGRRMPRALGDLGLAPEHFERHIAYDIGIEPVARRLAAAFDAPLVAQTYSRLVIDCNRPTHVPASIPTISEATPIPGNEGISQAERDARIAALFRPYHDTLERILGARKRHGVPTVLIALHSFTPVYNGTSRPWRLGLLYNRDPRLAGALLRILNDDAAPDIGDKLPYAVDDETDYTLPVHGEQRGLLHVGFEIRQDLIGDRAGQSTWAESLELLLRRVLLERLAPEFGG